MGNRGKFLTTTVQKIGLLANFPLSYASPFEFNGPRRISIKIPYTFFAFQRLNSIPFPKPKNGYPGDRGRDKFSLEIPYTQIFPRFSLDQAQKKKWIFKFSKFS